MSERFKASDVLYAIVVPCLVGLLIVIFSFYLSPVLDPTLKAIVVDGLGEAILIIGVPMLLGLVWNQWAGGASGFLLGSVYALYVNDTFVSAGVYREKVMMGGMAGDISNLGYVVCAILTGYIAGALNKGSVSFKHMMIAGLTGGIIGGLFLLWTQLISPFGMVTDVYYSIFITLLPRIIYGVVIPIIAKVFSWYGITPRQMN
jgi:hypothetical protein